MAVATFACVATLLCVFRVQFGSSFQNLLGDSFDGVLQISILQHWTNVFHAREIWNRTEYFYPWKDTLGYNDGYFITGIFFSAFRAMSLDPFLSNELTNLTLRAIGFFSFYLFATDVLGFVFGWALLGAVLVTLANNLYVLGGHMQLLTLGFAPLLVWLLWRMFAALTQRPASPAARRKASAWGCAAAILYGAWLITAFYMAWFTALFLATVAVVLALRWATRPVWRPVPVWPCLVVAGAFAVAVIPFLLVYLPKRQETGSHPFEATLPYAPSPLDLLHIGSHNVLFGWFDVAITAALRPGFLDIGEHTVGFPSVLATLGIAGTVAALWRRPTRAQPVGILALAMLVSFALVLHVGPVNLWVYVFRFVPGASAIRTAARYVLFLTLPVVSVAVWFLASHARRWSRWITALLVVALVAEEINGFTPIGLSRATEMRLLAAVPPPPPSCRAFYVTTPPDRPSSGFPDLDALYPHNVEAMLLAELFVLPTINGFSTFNPPDWNFAAPASGDYLPRVKAYLAAHNLSRGVCGLDIAHGAWALPPDPP